MLSYAIFNEADEVKYYRKLAEHARRESVRVLFIQMADESQEHYNTTGSTSFLRNFIPMKSPLK